MLQVNAKQFYQMMANASAQLERESDSINNLNVFPVPDGDTGSNMSRTMEGVSQFDGDFSSLGHCAKSIADAMLRCARGNSGVILSVFFRGFAKGISAEGDKVLSQSYDEATHTLSVVLAPVSAEEKATVTLKNAKAEENEDFKKDVFDFLMAAQLPVDDKNAINDVYKKFRDSKADIALGLNNIKMSESTRDALYELTFR